MPHVEYLTAATEDGRRAIQEVMRHSYGDDISGVPPRWAMARLVDGVPVSYLLVDPDRRMDMPRGELHYAFLMDVATREDRRREGHFRAIMRHLFSSLRDAEIPVVVTHGRHPLYRPFGFDVFTHHCGVFATPETIERTLGRPETAEGRQPEVTVAELRGLHKDLLLVTEVRAATLTECRAALQAAAALARAQGKTRILFEEPPAPSYGSRYPIRQSPETPLTGLARACGAEVRLQGANPEDGSIPDADWIQVVDAAAFVRAALACAFRAATTLPRAAVSIATESGAVTVDNSAGELRVLDGSAAPQPCTLHWPAAALAQWATGYRSAAMLCTIHSAEPFSPREEGAARAIALLDALFPVCWRFSRNETWTYSK